jgi:carbon storage regulator CsrA
MLVLSRRPNEKILFPTFNTAVEVVAIKPGVVRLAINAPAEVVVLREEVAARLAEYGIAQARSLEKRSELRELKHQLRNQLHVARVCFAVLDRQLQMSHSQDARITLGKITEGFQSLVQQLENAETKTPPQPSPPCRKSRALLVEDNPNECELLAAFLRMSGVEVDTAGDGSDALNYLCSHDRPDVVLLDMGLPRCDGPTMVREIRRDPAHAGLRIFAVTGRSEKEFDLERGPGGVDRWFQKPVDPLALVSDLNQTLAESLRL